MDSFQLRILVIGAGSMGARHARNLLAAGAAVTVTDPDVDRALAIRGAQVLPFDLNRLDGFDGVVVASPTSYHAQQAEAALVSGAYVLVEKPLAMNTAGLDQLLKMGKGRIMVGYNLRLHEPVERLVGWVHDGRVGKPMHIRLWFGQYLPDWRPGVDYRSTYSAHRDLGGGILLDAIHELDLLIWLLDDRLRVIGAIVDRVGGLDVGVEDTVKALLRHSDGAVIEVSLDYLSRGYRRGVEVIGDEATIRLDWARSVLEQEDRSGLKVEEAATPIERSYEREAQVFLSWIRGERHPPVDGVMGAASVRLAEEIRRTAG